MKNLIVVRQSYVKDFEDANLLRSARLFCVDSESLLQRVYFFCEGNRLFTSQIGTNVNQQIRLCCDFNAEGMISLPLLLQNESGGDDEDFQIVDAQYLFGHGLICVASKSGDIITYNTFTDEVESVGTIASGIKCMSWSPDQDLVIFATGDEKLLLMTRDFDSISEVPLHSEEFGENKPVNVGWGKKETQFHGSEGKQAAKQQINDKRSVFDWDDKVVRISWRGDGTSFVTSAVTPYSCIRQLRVWNRENVLQFSSDYVDGLEQSVCWEPSGNLIATSTITCNGGKHEIAFFERNCLRHGGFTLSANAQQSVKVREVLWNADSSLLAVWLEDLQDDVLVNSKLHIYSANNYHWYLKQSFHYNIFSDDESVSVLWVKWDPERAFDLHVLTSDGTYCRYSFLWVINNSVGDEDSNNSIVYVVDGQKILITPFRKVVVPPPMSAYGFEFDEPVNEIVVGPKSHSNDFAVVTVRNQLHFFSTDCGTAMAPASVKVLPNYVGLSVKPHQHVGTAEIFWPDVHIEPVGNILLHHWIWICQKTMIFSRIGAQNLCELCIANVEMSSDVSECSVIVRKVVQLPNEIFQLRRSSRETDVVIQCIDGQLMHYNCDTDVLSSFPLTGGQSSLKFPEPCSSMEVIACGGQEHVISLSDAFILKMDNVQLSDKCTSFYFNGDFIIYTTFDHLLNCLPISLFVNGVPDNKMLNQVADKRAIERGSQIVTVVPKDTKVILQMPRGNLETIHPRALVLHSIRKKLDRMQFKESLLIMRKHRIDMNLLFDHNPKMFLQNVEKFTEQVDDAILINLFLSSLRNEDVTKTVYNVVNMIERDCVDNGKIVEGKVDLICDALLQQMEKINEPQNKFLLAILTAHATKKVPELDIALQKIKAFRDANTYDETITPDMALRHLLCLIDVDKLYNVALGTYDFELVIMVAEKSQKDPKEYLPFLNELQKLDSNYQKYSIDAHLNYHEKALEHICKCGVERFEECLAFIKAHHLYSPALKFFDCGSISWKAVVHAHAAYLLSRNQLEEAGLTYFMGGFNQEALKIFKRCGNWKRAFCVAHKLSMPNPDIVELAQYFAAQLKCNRRFIEAAEVLENYAKDYDEAIIVLIEAHNWDSALLMMHRYDRLHMIQLHLRPALIAQSSSILVILDEKAALFERLKSRLTLVRSELEKRRQMQDQEFFLPDSDLYSETSSVTGISGQSFLSGTGSRFTSRTSRTKKKADRKKVSLKEGSPFEDIALLESLTDMIVQVDSMKEECGSLVQALLLHNIQHEASNVQSRLSSIIKHIITSRDIIWPPTKDTSLQFGPMATANSVIQQTANMNYNAQQNIPEDYISFLKPPKLRSGINWKLESLTTNN